MGRQIWCVNCKRSCGIIRDASLLKGLLFICEPCNKEVNAKLALLSFREVSGVGGDLGERIEDLLKSKF